MRILISFNKEELNHLCYSIVVETWDHKNYGKDKKRWLSEFTQQERDKISYWYKRFYHWYLVKGTPNNTVMRATTYQWLQDKVIPFFASI